jgi:hypothetical protein
MERSILERFPVLQLIAFSDQRQVHPENLPICVGLIAALLESADKPCCVILPDCSGVAIAVSTLVAINRLQAEFPELLRAHASVNFRQGIDLVLVQPAGLVYRYEGFFNPDFFKLGVLDRKDCRSLPVKDIARLEKTTHRRPKGKLASDLGRSAPSILGSLLEIKTTLNRNVLRNRVLLLGSRKRIVDELDQWSIQVTTDDQPLRRQLMDEVPFGKLIEGGELALLDGYIAEGEPLVAIASRPADLVAHCERAERFTKAVVISDVDQMAKDLRSYDSITENQRTVILATDADRDSARALEDRGCEIWRLTPNEILLGVETDTRRGGPLSSLITKARRVRNLVISEIPCQEERLDCAASELRGAADAVASIDNGTIRELFYSLFRLLMLCAEYIGHDPVHFRDVTTRLIQSTKEQLNAAKVWLTPETFTKVSSALENMHVVAADFTAASTNNPKATALVEVLRSSSDSGENQSAVIVARSRREDVEAWIKREGSRAQIYSIDEIPGNAFFERVLVLSWPRSSRFDDLVHRYLTSDLRLFAYPFEEKWLNQYRRAYKRSAVSEIPVKRKLELLGIKPATEQIEQTGQQMSEGSGELVTFDIREERFFIRRKRVARAVEAELEQEVLVDASYVDFVGPTFAYLTEGHELAVLNGYLSGQVASGSKVPMRSVDELEIGDYVLFRESGDSDVIRFIAEDQVGKETYQRLRADATRWRKALNSLGDDARRVWDRLRSVGFARHLLTVKSWLQDENRICPRDIDDVRKIAEASGDHALLELLPQLEKAKEELMSLHISAGFRLTQLLMTELPGKISSLGGGETELDLGIGKVWVVRIQDIERSASPQRRSQVNRLLWDLQSF